MSQKNSQSIPVVRASARDYELAALVGDDAVILGWTMADSIDRSDLLGFGIKRLRRDPRSSADGDCRWLPNHRHFALQGNDSDCGSITTQSAPLQQFHFIDYAIDSGCDYTYSVVPVRGTPALKYFEAPITVTVRPRTPWRDPASSSEFLRGRQAVELNERAQSRSNTFLPCPAADQSFGCVTSNELAGDIQNLTDQARSAVFLYSMVSLPSGVLDVVRQVNSGRLMYGMVPADVAADTETDRQEKRIQISQPAERQRLDPLTVHTAGARDVQRYTSALVTDPWSRSPAVLLWSDMPGTSPDRRIETRLIRRDKRSAARLATNIFHAYTAGRMPTAGGRPGSAANRHLEPDGRWSNIYFSRHAASHKYREREIFSGHP